MVTLIISLSDEEMHRLEELSKRESLTIEQMVRLVINVFISLSDDHSRDAVRHVIEKNADLYFRFA